MTPTPEQALQFAIMIQAGLPASQAILYFIQSDDPGILAKATRDWLNSRNTKSAQVKLQGKSWQDMSLEERIRYALDLGYAQMAYFIYSNHYAEVGPADKLKFDTARQALEAKLAGQAGKGDPLSEFLMDLKTGRIKLAAPPSVIPS